MRNSNSETSNHLLRIESHLLKNEREIGQLKEEVNDIQSRSHDILNNLSKLSSCDSHDAVKNLEDQLDTLKEELRYENILRSKIEEELQSSLNELRFYRTSTADDIAYQEKNELESLYENFITNFVSELRAQIHSCLLSPSDGQKITIGSRPDKYKCNGQVIGSSNLQEIMNEFKQQYNGSHQLIEDALHKVAELISYGEKLTKERNEAVECKEVAESELEQLRLVIDKLIEDSGQRTREEVDKVRVKANENIEKLLHELHHMEKERCQLAVELECLKSNSISNPADGISNRESKLGDSQLDSARRRAIQAEKLCDELKLQLETERNCKERLIASKQAEIEQLNQKIKSLEERLEHAETQFKQNEDHYFKQNKALLDSEIQLNALKRQLESVQKSAQYQIELAKQSMKVKETELNLKIETLEKVNQISDEKWRNLLDKQQKLSLQWRKEAQELANQLEEQCNAFKAQTERNHQK
uniref:Uncharacterized protein n=1 Tax=Trichobilharzia regenti TaxID=157069 RepID=A0AA85JZW1_TRIRE|nr:unnamed protein product [Trichobilharzia regenti]